MLPLLEMELLLRVWIARLPKLHVVLLHQRKQSHRCPERILVDHGLFLAMECDNAHVKKDSVIMKTSLHLLLACLGLACCVSASAQSAYRYDAPAKWNNFHPEKDAAQQFVLAQVPDDLPPPALTDVIPGEPPMETIRELPQGAQMPLAIEDQAMAAAAEDCETCEPTQLHRAVRGRLPLKPWFGSTNLLLYTMAGDSGRWVVSGTDMGKYTTALVDPEPAIGFDMTVGRYLCCGRFGLGLTYLNWNPDGETVVRTGNSGMIYSAMPTYNDISVNPGTGLDTLYGHIDGSATAVRTIRDVSFQGLEVNLSCFGLMGARRLSRNCCPKGCLGNGLGLCSHCYGYGGLTGPLVRPCNGRVRIVNSHGLRWFQAKDSMEFAYNIDGTQGYQADDIYENIEVENNLYGYQFGSMLSYCLTCRLNFTVGGKIGLYANDARFKHRVGTTTQLAYINGNATEEVSTDSSDTSFATLGELDFGLGYRIGCAWTIRGGYRMLGMGGVATAIDSIPASYTTLAASGKVYANSSYLLHGGYFGLECNW
jgi:hypothetical protein